MLKEYILYISLNILSTIGMSCYIFADTLFISQGIGANGLAALNVAIPGFSLISATGIMLGLGGSICYSRAKVRNSKKKMQEIFTFTMVLALIISIIYMIFGGVFSGFFVRILGANYEIFDITNIYFRIMYIFSPLFIFSNVLNFFVKNDGNPKLSMIAMLCGTFSNILLDYILIFPFKLGMLGAILATCMAPLVGIIILLFHFRNDTDLKFSKRIFGLRMIMIIFSGFPMFVTEICNGIVIVMFNMIMLNLAGNIGIAAFGIIANLAIITTALYNGIVQGAQPIITKYYALNDDKNLKRAERYTNILIIIISILVYMIFYIFADKIIGIFNGYKNSTLQSIASIGLKLYFLSLFAIGFNLFNQVKLICIKKVKLAQAISISRGIIVLMPITAVLVYLSDIIGVWLAVPLTEMIIFILTFKKVNKNKEKSKYFIAFFSFLR